MSFHLAYTQGNPNAANVTITVESLQEAGSLIVAIVKEAAIESESLGGFSIIEA